MPSFDYPSNSVLVDQAGMPSTPWQQVFSRWNSIISSVQESGTTAQRPTRFLWIGRRFWDKSLQIPIYVASVRPDVWKNSNGVAV